MRFARGLVVGLAGFSLILTSCGGGGDSSGDDATVTTRAAEEGSSSLGAPSFTSVSPEDAAAITADPPDGLVVLDVRTPEEYAEGHLDGAVLVDFYDADFADQLAALDKDVPYLVYCRSGNRSGQTIPLMQQLGFDSAVDVDGGILAWAGAGLPVTTG
jgi:rhodanese-related sulfurtransferase